MHCGLCVGHMGELSNTAELIEVPFGRWGDFCASKELDISIRRGPDQTNPFTVMTVMWPIAIYVCYQLL